MLENKIEQRFKEKMDKTKEIEMQKVKTIIENQERIERKNNIVIMRLENSSKNAKDRAIEFFKEKLEIQIEDKVKWVKEVGINKKLILVSLKDWEDKQEVMGEKGQLKGTKIYINHDLSREDRDIQCKLKEIAKQEREQGAEVKLGFRKIRINGN